MAPRACPHGRASLRTLLLLSIVLAGMASTAPAAFATHLQGGYFTANVTASATRPSASRCLGAP